MPYPVRRLAGATVAAVLLAPVPLVAQIRDYDAVVPSAAETRRGLFDVHRVDEKLLFEIPDSLLGREMIVMSRYARTQEGLGGAGANMAPNIVVKWERRDDRILLRATAHENIADEGSAIHLAVANSNFAPILHSLPIQARGRSSSVVEVTDLYLTDVPAFTLPRNQRQRFGVRNLDRSRSWIEWSRSFPTNVEIRVVHSYAADQPPSNARGGTVSYEVNHSMVVLPAEPMMARLNDERVGYISTGVTNYSRDYQGVRSQQFIRRYRLEPSDPEAFARGELVEPVNPWVWYIDPATPPEWIPYFRDGLLEWNRAFEEAGFRNAIQVHVAPTEEEDSTFSLLDARHSVVRYNASPTRSANASGDVVDPRSGEVIRAHINMYHGLMERMRWQLLSQVAGANPEFRTARLSQEDMGEALRYVISHEMAHAVGFPHNQRANFVYPVDSLRNADFVERRGHSASTVGRTRFNYVAQEGDDVPVERGIGIWDIFATVWGYRPIPAARTPEEELDTLNAWIVERTREPWFRFGDAQFGEDVEWDPYRMTEGISDDPVAAAVYGMINLRKAAENLVDWVSEPGEDYYELETHYLQLLTQWERYILHASAVVGGSHTYNKRFGEEGVVYTPVPAEKQREAMAFFDAHVFTTPQWALDEDLLRRIEHAGAIERTRAYQVSGVRRLLNHARLARLIEQEAFLGEAAYGPAEMLDDLRDMIWRELSAGATIDTWRRNLQRGYLEYARALLHTVETPGFQPPSSGNLRVSRNDDPPLNADIHVGQSDIRPLIREQLGLLRADVRQALDRGVRDRMSRVHLEDALERIDAALRAPVAEGAATRSP